MSKRYVDNRLQTVGPVEEELQHRGRRAKSVIGNSDPQADSFKRDVIVEALPMLPSAILDNLVLVITHQLDRGARQTNVQKLADQPRELWASRPEEKRRRGTNHESATQFCRRVYADWITSGLLTNETLFASDPDLLHALRLWVQRHPADGIPGLRLRLPTLDERIARLGPGTEREEIIRLGYALNKEKSRSPR
ncbi:MAG: hypothetical protein EOP18_00915 [Rhizobiaceae bacterium]|nr:MAG: hypothetical protein EOP18_00915 [Rhizobiaceae bacterium]